MGSFLQFLAESILLEGGKAIKASKPITQVEARHMLPDVIKRVSKALGVPERKIRLLGSAGKKPKDDDLSGDIDLAVEASRDDVESALKKLSFDGSSYRPMENINCYSFGHEHVGKVAQVDLIPVKNSAFAEWSMQANPKDLKSGLKGAHRNELMFAVCKHADYEDDGELVKRYFYDLSRGLFRGSQQKLGSKDKPKLKTLHKELLTDDPAEICLKLFGKGATPEKLSTFKGVLKAIQAPSFPHGKKTEEILKMAVKGMKNKGLSIPAELNQYDS